MFTYIFANGEKVDIPLPAYISIMERHSTKEVGITDYGIAVLYRLECKEGSA